MAVGDDKQSAARIKAVNWIIIVMVSVGEQEWVSTIDNNKVSSRERRLDGVFIATTL